MMRGLGSDDFYNEIRRVSTREDALGWTRLVGLHVGTVFKQSKLTWYFPLSIRTYILTCVFLRLYGHFQLCFLPFIEAFSIQLHIFLLSQFSSLEIFPNL